MATILSVAMLLRYSLEQHEAANAVEAAVKQVLVKGYRTSDIFDNQAGTHKVGTTGYCEG